MRTKIKTPTGKDLEEKEDKILEMMKNHLFDNLDFLKDIEISDDFLLKGRYLRSLNWEELLTVAYQKHIDISDQRYLRNKAEAVSKIRDVIKRRKQNE